jgi:hypothetical protein
MIIFVFLLAVFVLLVFILVLARVSKVRVAAAASSVPCFSGLSGDHEWLLDKGCSAGPEGELSGMQPQPPSRRTGEAHLVACRSWPHSTWIDRVMSDIGCTFV